MQLQCHVWPHSVSEAPYKYEQNHLMPFLKTMPLSQGLVRIHSTARCQNTRWFAYWRHFGDASYTNRKARDQAYDKSQTHHPVTSSHASWLTPAHPAGSGPGRHCSCLPGAVSPGTPAAWPAGWHSARSVCWRSAASPPRAHFQASHLTKNMKGRWKEDKSIWRTVTETGRGEKQREESAGAAQPL